MKKSQFKRPRNFVPSLKSAGTTAVVTEKVEIQDPAKTIKELEEKYSDQAKRHQKRVEELLVKIADQEQQLKPILGVSDVNNSLLVKNPHTFWKWLSTWAFAAIAYVSISGVPPELLALIPEASQGKVTALIAVLGFVGRFINQSRGK